MSKIILSFLIIVAFILIITLVLWVTKNSYTRPFTDQRGHIIKGSVAEEIYLPLGGVKQWVLLRGESAQNPILIFLHGGPGISLHALFRYFHHDLEKHFIVVGWDQRGAGKSYNKSIDDESFDKILRDKSLRITQDERLEEVFSPLALSIRQNSARNEGGCIEGVRTNFQIARFVEDLHELIDYLKKRFHQDKVYLLGESWGSLLGIAYAQKYPEDVVAYIGTGQISDMQKSEQLGYEFMFEQAERQHNKKALAQLRNIQQPPYSKVEDIKILRKWLMHFGGALYNQKSYFPWILKMLTVDEYAWPDLLKINAGHTKSLHALHNELFHTNLFMQIPELNVPVYFLLGKHDQQVSSKLAAEYLNVLKAPQKELIWFEKSGHNPMFEEPALFNQALLSIRYNFAFKSVEESDLPLLYTWFKKPHVEQWWPVPTDQEDFFSSFLKRIRSGIKKAYIVLCNNQPIGYIQSYQVDPATSLWLPRLPGTVIGIDQFIGDPAYLYKGIGPLFIKEFIKNLLEKDNNLTIIVDPDPTNTAAIKSYEKVGFKKVGEYQTPDGLALLMTYRKE